MGFVIQSPTVIDATTLYIYIYLFHTQSTHIDKSYINSNTIIHRINDKYIIMPGHISVNKILRNNHK